MNFWRSLSAGDGYCCRFPIPTGIEIELAKLGEVRVWREDGPMPRPL